MLVRQPVVTRQSAVPLVSAALTLAWARRKRSKFSCSTYAKGQNRPIRSTMAHPLCLPIALTENDHAPGYKGMRAGPRDVKTRKAHFADPKPTPTN